MPARADYAPGASHHRPDPVPAADWQAGVSPGNELLRVLLDGEPVVGAVAASVAGGWVDVLPEPGLRQDLRPGPGAPLGVGYRIDPFAGRRRLRGAVRIVSGDRT